MNPLKTSATLRISLVFMVYEELREWIAKTFKGQPDLNEPPYVGCYGEGV
jgi:hypothetical protein